MLDQMKMVAQMKKMQDELKKTLIEAQAGAVTVVVTGELKVKDVTIDPDEVDLDDIEQLEKDIKDALREAMNKAQEVAAEKMKPLMGGLGSLGLK